MTTADGGKGNFEANSFQPQTTTLLLPPFVSSSLPPSSPSYPLLTILSFLTDPPPLLLLYYVFSSCPSCVASESSFFSRFRAPSSFHRAFSSLPRLLLTLFRSFFARRIWARAVRICSTEITPSLALLWRSRPRRRQTSPSVLQVSSRSFYGPSRISASTTDSACILATCSRKFGADAAFFELSRCEDRRERYHRRSRGKVLRSQEGTHLDSGTHKFFWASSTRLVLFRGDRFRGRGGKDEEMGGLENDGVSAGRKTSDLA